MSFKAVKNVGEESEWDSTDARVHMCMGIHVRVTQAHKCTHANRSQDASNRCEECELVVRPAA